MVEPMKGKVLEETSALKIKEAAREVFVAKGYDGATMQAIADRAGFNKAQLHYYYRSKDTLFLLIFREEMQALLRPAEGLSVRQPGPVAGQSLREVLKFWIDDRAQFLRKFPQMPMFLINEVNRNPALIRTLLQELRVFAVPAHLLELAREPEGVTPAASEVGDRLEVLLTGVLSLLVFPTLGGPIPQILLDVQPERWAQVLDRQVGLAKSLVDVTLR